MGLSMNSESGSSISVKKLKELKRLFASDLCNRCGSCVGLSGGKIVFTDRTKAYRPHILDSDISEELYESVMYACSGRSFDFPYFQEKCFGSRANHPYTGNFRQIYIGYTTDNEVRFKSASGGIISQILIWLLENGKIDGAVVTRMSHTEPWLTEPFIATTREDILEAAQSKYIITSVNEILPEINKFKGRLAYVGLPGQVQSIRKLQAIHHPCVKNINFIFGPFYGNTLHFSSIRSFLKSHKLNDFRQISELNFRHGEWPGNLRVELKSGRVIELKKFHANYLIPFHILKNSLLCVDFTNEFTDISGGDAWAPVYEERGKGYSMIIARSEAGMQIIQQMQEAGVLNLDSLSAEKAIEMHSHGYDLKKRGAFIRMELRKIFGFQNPDYGNYSFKAPALRYLMEVIIVLLFLLFRTSLMIWLSERISPERIGVIFEKTRKLWKKSTHNIKRNKL